MNRSVSYSLFLAVFLTSLSFSQMKGSAGATAGLEPRTIIDVPTAGILPHGTIGFDIEFFQEGGVLVGLSGGLFHRVELGVAYGGAHLLGAQQPIWNQTPGWRIKIRVYEESSSFPAIVLGFDTQGKELYIDSLNRYTIKSPGMYAVASKNYQLLGYFGIHGGMNYSLERSDGDSDPNFFVGIDKALGPIFSIVAEYNFGLNDSNREALGKGKGYLNAGFRTSLGNGFTLGFNLKDVTKNQQDISIGNRTIQLEFVRTL
jgi:hypothetical protein